MQASNLYLIPTFLSENQDESSIAASNLQVIHSLKHFIVEREKTARAFLKKVRHPLPQSEFIFVELNEHSSNAEQRSIFEIMKQGHDVGLMSEAGMPCLADPGAQAVAFAHKNGIKVKPLSGPSSIILALTASGLNGQNFTFHGYLPVDKIKRQQKIKNIERVSKEQDQTQIFIETPYRNLAMFDEILRSCWPDTRLCVATEIQDPEQELIRTLSIKQWKAEKPDLNKKPTVFLIQA